MQRFIDLTLRRGSTLKSLERRDSNDLAEVLKAFSTYLPKLDLTLDEALEAAKEFLSGAGSWLNEVPQSVLDYAICAGLLQKTPKGYKKVYTDSYTQEAVEEAYRVAEQVRQNKRSKMRAKLQEKNRRVNTFRVPAHPQDEVFMSEALTLAKKAADMGEIPVGCVIVKDGRIIARGYNRSIQDCDPSGHAEVVAIREAAKVLNNYRLNGCTLYVTLEPCAMCTALIAHARIDRVVFAADDLKTGAFGGMIHLIEAAKINHRPTVDKGLLALEASALLSRFFEKMRAQ